MPKVRHGENVLDVKNRSIMMNQKRVEYCEETRNRIRVALWAYAYEIKDDPLVCDQMFDETCAKIDVRRSTSNPKMDAWFREHFDPDTGQWIYEHPGLKRFEEIYQLMIASDRPLMMPVEIILEDMF